MSEELKPEYRNPRFRCSQESLPEEFRIVSAYNPDGKDTEEAANKIADEALLKLLSDRGYPHFRVIGGNSDFTHAEPGYGIVCSQAEALGLAREFRQDAIFEVIGGRVLLLSAKSTNSKPELIGKWIDLVDSP